MVSRILLCGLAQAVASVCAAAMFGSPKTLDYMPASGMVAQEFLATPEGFAVLTVPQVNRYNTRAELVLLTDSGPQLRATFPSFFEVTGFRSSNGRSGFVWIARGGNCWAGVHVTSSMSTFSNSFETAYFSPTQGGEALVRSESRYLTFCGQTPTQAVTNRTTYLMLDDEGRLGSVVVSESVGCPGVPPTGSVGGMMPGGASETHWSNEIGFVRRVVAAVDRTTGLPTFLMIVDGQFVVATSPDPAAVRTPIGDAPDGVELCGVGVGNGEICFIAQESSKIVGYLFDGDSLNRNSLLEPSVGDDYSFPVFAPEAGGFHSVFGVPFPSPETPSGWFGSPLGDVVFLDFAPAEGWTVRNEVALCDGDIEAIHFDLLSASNPRYAVVVRNAQDERQILYLARGESGWNALPVRDVPSGRSAYSVRAGRDSDERPIVSWIETGDGGLRHFLYSKLLEDQVGPGNLLAIR